MCIHLIFYTSCLSVSAALSAIQFVSFVCQIDFVAHDDIPYSSAGSEDVYKHIKEAGQCTMPLKDEIRLHIKS